MNSQPSQSGRSPSANYSSPTTTSTSGLRDNKDSFKHNNSFSLSKTASDAGIQSLSSILNNPLGGKSGVYGSDASWVGWLSSSSTSVAPPEFAPVISTKASCELTRSDFQNYVSSITESHHRFEEIREHANTESLNLESLGGQGEALVACLREVPSLYFKEDFALEDGATFRAACPFLNVSENLVLQEKLSQYLDVVELHLVKEISLRSNSFFEAQGQLEDLNIKIVEGCSRIRQLKETIRLIDHDLVDSASQIQDLNFTRVNMLALQQKLRLILYVNQALSALKLLVASGDCAGALDVTDDLQNLLDGDELSGLHCFLHLRDHVTVSIESINRLFYSQKYGHSKDFSKLYKSWRFEFLLSSILTAEFLRGSIHDVGDTDMIILCTAKARASMSNGNNSDAVKLGEDETSSLRDRLLPLIIGLLRTAKLPSVLRIYRDTLTTDMKTAIKTAVAELLPVLVARPLESDYTSGERMVDADGGGLSLASKLRSLSSESFIQLLGAIFQIVKAHLVRAAEVKKTIEWTMSNVDGHYAVDSVAAAISLGAAAAAADTANEKSQDGSLLPHTPAKGVAKVPLFQGKANEASSPGNFSRNFRADVLRENTEALFSACDAAHGRWAKLLGVRAILHPKLRLQDFLSIYNMTQEFIITTEKIGGRLGYSIRGTLQSQAKSFVDSQHESRMTKMKAVLDQETWAEVDVPDEFQAIVTSLFCSEALITQNVDDGQVSTTTSGSHVVLSNEGPPDTQTQNADSKIERTDASEISDHKVAEVKSLTSDTTDRNKANIVSHSAQSNSKNLKERGKSTSQTLFYNGVGYHMVNCGLILLKMLSEYIDMNKYLPSLSSEVVQRVVDILKFFNTRTCQLVLGAGAMQVSGLKSITSKHLALASQVISFTYAIIPEIRRILFLKVPDTRKALLSSELDRVAQDYKVHRDEIHTKLVQIMRERLLVHLRGLPQIVESWNRPEDADSQPSHFARSLTKEVGFLQRVLSRTLHEVDVQAIFRQVIIIFHSQISEAFLHLEISTPQAKKRLKLDVTHVLACIRSLPSDNMNTSSIPNWGLLDEFLEQKFGAEDD